MARQCDAGARPLPELLVAQPPLEGARAAREVVGQRGAVAAQFGVMAGDDLGGGAHVDLTPGRSGSSKMSKVTSPLCVSRTA